MSFKRNGSRGKGFFVKMLLINASRLTSFDDLLQCYNSVLCYRSTAILPKGLFGEG